MKKFWIWSLVIALVAAFSGCAQEGAETEEAAPPAAETQAE